MSSSTAWSDDRVTTVRKLWIDGRSASQIAAALGGVSRCAVLGKIYRLGLVGRATPSAPGKAARPRGVRSKALRPTLRLEAPAPPANDRLEAANSVESPGLVENVMGLSAQLCRWPIGDPKSEGFSFCGRPASGTYCQAHAMAGVQPGKTMRLDRDPIVRRALAGLA